jgi:hypothetical protein
MKDISVHGESDPQAAHGHAQLEHRLRHCAA